MALSCWLTTNCEAAKAPSAAASSPGTKFGPSLVQVWSINQSTKFSSISLQPVVEPFKTIPQLCQSCATAIPHSASLFPRLWAKMPQISLWVELQDETPWPSPCGSSEPKTSLNFSNTATTDVHFGIILDPTKSWFHKKSEKHIFGRSNSRCYASCSPEKTPSFHPSENRSRSSPAPCSAPRKAPCCWITLGCRPAETNMRSSCPWLDGLLHGKYRTHMGRFHKWGIPNSWMVYFMENIEPIWGDSINEVYPIAGWFTSWKI